MIQPQIVSLGPILNDAIFKTLVESRPEISKAFYRPSASFSSATEAPARTFERYAPGDVVSVPLGKKFMGTLKDLVSGGKASPEAGIPVMPSAGMEDYFTFLGAAEKPQILVRTEPPAIPFSTGQSTEIEFSVDATGHVIDLEVVKSSSDTSVDFLWENHLRQWVFASESGRLRVKFLASSERTT